MGRLYRDANRVVAWLGSGDDSRVDHDRVQSAFALMTAIRADHRRAFQISVEQTRVFMPLLSLRYWTRKWIIQEVMVAKSVVLQSESYTVPLSSLVETLSILGAHVQ